MSPIYILTGSDSSAKEHWLAQKLKDYQTKATVEFYFNSGKIHLYKEISASIDPSDAIVVRDVKGIKETISCIYHFVPNRIPVFILTTEPPRPISKIHKLFRNIKSVHVSPKRKFLLSDQPQPSKEIQIPNPQPRIHEGLGSLNWELYVNDFISALEGISISEDG